MNEPISKHLTVKGTKTRLVCDGSGGGQRLNYLQTAKAEF